MTDRYARQMLFTDIGKEGQTRLGDSCVVLIGCGAALVFIKTSSDFHGIFTNACYHSVNAPLNNGVTRAANKCSQGG
jgi:hypothetical protein